jgi:hypothetical protein
MRSLADGKIRWCFFPPDTTTDRTGKGVWLGGTEEEVLEDSDGAVSVVESLSSEEEEDGPTVQRRKSVHFEDDEEQEEEEDEDEDEDESSESEREMRGAARNPFAALQLEDQSDEDDDDDDDDEDDSDEDEDIKK